VRRSRYGPQDTATKREAVQFFRSDVDVRPVIRSIDDLDRLEEWITVASALAIDGEVRRALRYRRQALHRRDADVAFHPASDIDAVHAESAPGDTAGVVDDAVEQLEGIDA